MDTIAFTLAVRAEALRGGPRRRGRGGRLCSGRCRLLEGAGSFGGCSSEGSDKLSADEGRDGEGVEPGAALDFVKKLGRKAQRYEGIALAHGDISTG
jgi:hypothetical protein